MTTLEKLFSHPSLVIYIFATSPIKVMKLGQQIGGGLLIPNHHLRPETVNVTTLEK
jgi:hypothetical protein